MRIVIGSKNPVKVDAVKEVIKDYPTFANAEIISIAAASDVSDQPLSLEEIIQGAKNRARNALIGSSHCKYGFGLESGIFSASGSQTGYLESCICAIFDGSTYALGLSCGFEIPPHILEYVIDHKMDLSQACLASKMSANPKLGSAEGLIGLLTQGRVTRKEYTKQCITTALIQIENLQLYTSN